METPTHPPGDVRSGTLAAESVPARLNEPPRLHRFHPLTWIATLYSAESLPYAAVVMVSVLMYRDLRGEVPSLTDGRIAFYTAWLALPWSLKPFWSPFLELYKTKKHIVLATQFLAGVLFALMALTLKAPMVVQGTLAVFFILAFNSATHDIAADGVYMESLSQKEQSKYVGFQSAFWTLGSVLAQGAFVKLAGELEKTMGVRPAWTAVMLALALAMVLLGGWHARVLPSGRAELKADAPARSPVSFRTVLQAFFLKKNLWWMIVFTLLYRVAEAQVTKIAPLFLRADRAHGGLGLDTSQVGLIYGTIATASFVAGSVAGGAFASRLGLRRALPWLCVCFNVPNALFTFLAFATPSNLAIITVCAGLEKFALGFGQVAIILFMMQQLAPGRFKMAHYGFATALMNLGVMVPGMISGSLSDLLGYRWFFVYVLIAAVPSFAVSLLVPFREIIEDDPEEDPQRSSRKPSTLAPLLLGGALVSVIALSTWLQLRGPG